MPVAKGSKSKLLTKEETAYGVAPSGNWDDIAFVSESLAENIRTIVSDEIQSNRQVPNVRGGNISSGGTVTQEFGARRHMTWMRHLLAATQNSGAAVVTPIAGGEDVESGDVISDTAARKFIVTRSGNIGADGGNDIDALPSTYSRHEVGTAEVMFLAASGDPVSYHSLVAGIDLPAVGIAFEKAILGGTAPMYQQFLGGRINTLRVTIPQEGIVRAEWDVLTLKTGATTTVSGGGAPVRVSEQGYTGFESEVELSFDGQLSWVAETALREGNFQITNNIQDDQFRIGSRHRFDLPENRREITGSVSMYFQSKDRYDLFRNETTFAMRFHFIGQKGMIRFTFPNVRFTGNPSAQIGGQESIMSNFDFQVFNPTGVGSDVSVMSVYPGAPVA